MNLVVKSVLRIVIIGATLIAISDLVPGISLSGFTAVAEAALIWWVISLLLKPVLSVLTLPINILTLGLFSLIVNAALFWLLSLLTPGLTVAGFVPALEGSFLLSIVMWFLHKVL